MHLIAPTCGKQDRLKPTLKMVRVHSHKLHVAAAMNIAGGGHSTNFIRCEKFDKRVCDGWVFEL